MLNSRRKRRRARRNGSAADNVIPVDRLEQERIARLDGEGSQSRLRLTDVEDIASRWLDGLEGIEDDPLEEPLTTAGSPDRPETPLADAPIHTGASERADPLAASGRDAASEDFWGQAEMYRNVEQTNAHTAPASCDSDAPNAHEDDVHKGNVHEDWTEEEEEEAPSSFEVSEAAALTDLGVTPIEAGADAGVQAEAAAAAALAERLDNELHALAEGERRLGELQSRVEAMGAAAPSSEVSEAAALAERLDDELRALAEGKDQVRELQSRVESVRAALRSVLNAPSDDEPHQQSRMNDVPEPEMARAAPTPDSPVTSPLPPNPAHVLPHVGPPHVDDTSPSGAHSGPASFAGEAPVEPETALQRATEQLDNVLRGDAGESEEPSVPTEPKAETVTGEIWPHDRDEAPHASTAPDYSGGHDYSGSHELSAHAEHTGPSGMTDLLDEAPPRIVRSDLARTPAKPRFGGGAAVGLVGGLILAGAVGSAVYFLAGEPGATPPGVSKASIVGGGGDTSLLGRKQARVKEGGSSGPVALIARDVTGNAGRTVSMDLTVSDFDPARGALVRISGLPDGARLSDGLLIGSGTWLVPGEKVHDLTLDLPANISHDLSLAAGIVESDGKTRITDVEPFRVRVREAHVAAKEVAASMTASALPPMDSIPPLGLSLADLPPGAQETLTTPAPAPALRPVSPRSLAAILDAPDVQPTTDDDEEEEFGDLPTDIKGLSAPTLADIAAAPIINRRRSAALSDQPIGAGPGTPRASSARARTASAIAKAEERIHRGDKLMKAGDIKGARKFYLDAARFSAAHAALALGRSYDPNYVRRIKSANADADANAALQWYRKAVAAGLPSAQVKVTRLLKTMGR